VRWAVLALTALALTGCQTTAEKSAGLERAAKGHEAALGSKAQQPHSITHTSTRVRVTATAVVHSSEGTAAVVTLRNTSSLPLHALPIAITVTDARGQTLYRNDAAGQQPTLATVALVPAHSEVTWIDDQVQASGAPARVSARVGEGQPVTGPAPSVSVAGVHVIEDPTSGLGAEGNVLNRSTSGHPETVVYALARRAGRIVAAGRAVLPQAPAGASTRFQLFFIGDPRGGQLQVSVQPVNPG
jgi:hypothetical protein